MDKELPYKNLAILESDKSGSDSRRHRKKAGSDDFAIRPAAGARRRHPDASERSRRPLVRELAARYQEDREGYTEAKAVFVREITTKALQIMTKSKETPLDGMSH